MKKLVLLSFIVLLLAFVSCDSEKTVLPRFDSFVKLYGEFSNQFGVDIATMPNDDMIILGRVDDLQTSYIYLSRVDTLGNVIWEETFDDKDENTSERPVAMAVDSQGNIIVTGTIISSFPSVSDIFVYKFSPSGDMTNSRIFDVPVNEGDAANFIDVASDIIVRENEDGSKDYLISGSTKKSSTDPEEYFHVLLTEDLLKPEEWNDQIYPTDTINSFERKGSRIGLTLNNNFISVVSSTSFSGESGNPAGYNIEVIRFSGNTGSSFGVPGKSIDGTENDDFIKSLIKRKNDREFIYAANSASIVSPGIRIGRLSIDGTVLSVWDFPAGRKLEVVDMVELPDGQLVLLGKEIITDDDHNLYMAQFDLITGNVSWEHSYGGDERDEAAAMVAVDNKIFALGTIKRNTNNKIVLLKTSDQGRL
ncbi:MAG: hypothetical protein ACNS60_09770 [Candidatus Cyclobacteriaceae bacterium M2_1C_046]